ncbi:excalibur calcium-binding domain-containing protein [Kocuria salina]|uniref:excalibur calcium-binding domain-containing protein n=1 Tax=Kocuria salina TaxID=1929416 RepID=UPI0015938DB3|nr:excalibur calcium-binding domain-containing protein [Kocuria salina]
MAVAGCRCCCTICPAPGDCARGLVPAIPCTNCSAARATGAAPGYAGQPVCGSHLDRDGMGYG